MTLTDAGVLVALLDADDPYHTACVAAAQRLPAGPLLTTWVCFTEAMYLLGSVGGYRYQACPLGPPCHRAPGAARPHLSRS